ncbi:MAG: diguanylate cyclase (GGDEF)-like protein [Colwellia sp.]|jgi:diguanylate cyclase (GGDEF)-like protein
MAKRYKFIFNFVLIALLAISIQAFAANVVPKLKQVSVQLKWFHQFQFAGFYAAIEQGYFTEAGLNVKLIEGGPTIKVIESVTSGKAEFGIGNSSLLIDYNNGSQIVAVATLFQHSPSIILARRDETIRTVKDLEGRTIMGKLHTAELMTYLKVAGVDLKKIKLVPHTGTVESLKRPSESGIDATTAYLSSEPFLATQLNIPYHIFNPRDLNIDFYGDTLFTSSRFANLHPEIVTAMRNSLIKGWQYALKNSDELVSIILAKYHPKKDRLALSYESQAIIPLFESDIVDIGLMSHRRWHEIGSAFVKSETLKQNYTVDGFLFENKEPLPTWVYNLLVASLLIITLTTFIAVYILSINRRLTLSLEQIKEQKEIIEYQATHDTLTGLPELRLLHERWDKAVSRADRDNSRAAILFIDLDGFKLVNDTYGHHAGDFVLKIVSSKLNKSIRNVDTAARLGGDEFIVILDCIKSIEDAPLIANKLIAAISQPISFNNSAISIGASIGIAIYPVHSSKPEEIIKLADLSMYKAKQSGKNKFKMYS